MSWFGLHCVINSELWTWRAWSGQKHQIVKYNFAKNRLHFPKLIIICKKINYKIFYSLANIVEWII